MHTPFSRFRLIAFVAMICSSGPGCSSLKIFRKHAENATSSAEIDLLTEDSVADPVDPTEKRISLLHARASLAEMDKLPLEAIQSYETILEMDSSNVPALHRLALLQIQQCKYDEAEKRFQAALLFAPDNALIRNDYGYFCHLQNRPEDAATQLVKAVELNPGYLAAHNNLGLVLAGEGKHDEAEHHFRLGKCDQAETLNNLALARFMKSDLDQASTLYSQAVAVNPNLEQARDSLASVNRISGQGERVASDTNDRSLIAPVSYQHVHDSLGE